MYFEISNKDKPKPVRIFNRKFSVVVETESESEMDDDEHFFAVTAMKSFTATKVQIAIRFNA